MRKNLPTVLIIIVFLAGAGVFLYPTVANFFYEQNGTKVIMDHEEKVEKMTPEEIEAEKEAVRRYNTSLVDNPVVLTDPFDPDAVPITDGEYDKLLAQDEMMGYVEVPVIDVKIPIYHGTDEQVLEKGAGHLENTSLPMGGKSTHTVLSAHCGLPSAKLFTDLTSVKKGDFFRIYVLDQVLTYKVYDIQVVLPENTSSLMIEKDRDLATLVTCTPYGKNTHRLLVHGERTKEQPEEQTRKVSGGVTMDWDHFAKAAAAVLAAVFLILILAGIFRKRKKEE